MSQQGQQLKPATVNPAVVAAEPVNMGTLLHSTLNPAVVSAEYAVRGEIVLAAGQLQERLAAGETLPFDKIVYSNVGNPQALGQPPLTFPRQVLSLLVCPHLLAHPKVGELFPSDVIERARSMLALMPGGTGAYSSSQGLDFVREHVAEFIAKRDGGVASNKNDIFLSNGASEAIRNVLLLLVRTPQDGIMIPVPQYPLYTATLALLRATPVPYYLDEAKEWALDPAELSRAYDEACSKGVNVRAIVVINPGNPTGQCLSEQNVREIVKFAMEKKLVILADEVYQENVYYSDHPFSSFKKAVRELHSPMELASFHSTSKGSLGECGRRGGYVEVVNFAPDVKAELLKLFSINLCCAVDGQAMVRRASSRESLLSLTPIAVSQVDLMVKPPQKGEPSYEQFERERIAILQALKSKAERVVSALRALPGVTCTSPMGAMYAFPQITLPPRAVAHARELGKAPDAFYCLELLRATGVVVVPGSGFGQRDGSFHFRTTFLPPIDQMDEANARIAKFHLEFMQRFA